MRKFRASVCLSVVPALCAVGVATSVLADGRSGVGVGRDGSSVSAGRGGASVSAGRSSVSASRDGASVGTGRSSVSASRDGASVSAGDAARGIAAASRSSGSVNAAGDREYNDMASWFEDLRQSWSGGEEKAVSRDSATKSSSVEQVSEATATSTDGRPAVAEASNTKVTRQY